MQKEQTTSEARRQAQYASPEVNIYETPEGYLLEAEMPGVTRDGIEISLEGAEITITGHRQVENPPGEVLVRESRPVDYRRVFEIDPAIDTSRVAARVDQGVLTVTLPKSERVKPRQIKVD